MSVDSVGMVHIVDDDDLLADALSSLLRSIGHTVRLYSSADSFLTSEIGGGAGCLLADVRLPGISGLELQETLRRTGRAMPIILMTGFGDVRMSVQAMKAGAIDFLEKPFRDQDLLDAVTVALDADRANRAGGARTEGLQTRYDTLTAREREVMAMVCDGKLNKEVAGVLGLSEVTVKVHR